MWTLLDETSVFKFLRLVGTNVKLALVTNEMITSNLPALYSDLKNMQLTLKGHYFAAGNFQEENESIIDAFPKSK